MYFWQRDRVVRLSKDPSQLIINFKEADRLKVDELFPQSARRQLSETLENTDVVSVFLDRWDVEDHEVEIALERGVVRDVQARVRRARLAHPEEGLTSQPL